MVLPGILYSSTIALIVNSPDHVLEKGGLQ